MPRKRNVCFVTGTRAEFGLMTSVLGAVRAHPRLNLQLVATGMHLSRAHGDGLGAIRAGGWRVDRVVPWKAGSSPVQTAVATGAALGGLARAFDELASDVVLVVGDRVEAFAAASAAAISGRVLAHVHGGDRALGQVDDALRHAITKLAHVHFPATRGSADRIRKLGEDAWRIHIAGSPGLDGIVKDASGRRAVAGRYGAGPFALVVLHPTSAEADVEHARATLLLKELHFAGVARLVIIGSNNDPGSPGITRAWREAGATHGVTFVPDVPRPDFLGLMRDAAFLIGNSSAGIIEAASFGTPVLDVGDRQKGRERSANVTHVAFNAAALRKALRGAACARRVRCRNVYGAGRAAGTITRVLASLEPTERLVRKLITY